MIRVLIADDSLLTRIVLRDLLSRDPESRWLPRPAMVSRPWQDPAAYVPT